ncbi:MAG TPA: S8 family serine peptidase [Verrucomicrobiae bacterium]|nr:S8 family serine peptidase [Verrucomicrobiae bacterium]
MKWLPGLALMLALGLAVRFASHPENLPTQLRDQNPPREIPGRLIPDLVLLDELSASDLPAKAIPLPEANTLAHIHFQTGYFGRAQNPGDHEIELFNPECVLVKFRGRKHVDALRVEAMRESEAVRELEHRSDVEFAELDIFESPQFVPDDPQITNQWHHKVIGSYRAWDYGLGRPSVRIAIVDKPFQTDHPDLAANTVPGWDIVANAPIKPGPGNWHATMCAGMAAAVINNGKGVAGAGNCAILPISINGAISEMYNATVWAADHGARVVNISWTGANTATLEAAGRYLKTKARGILAMPAGDGKGRLNWTNQPDVYCISMTDAADNLQSHFGPHVDFAAPGYKIYSTATGGGYAYGSGASYSSPLFCGVVAVLFSINPALGPDDAIDILKRTSVQLGQRPWNEYYGWGRIDFAAAAAAAAKPRGQTQSGH